jgi:glutamate formiminotransferase
VIEFIPNVSEGRRSHVVARLVSALAGVPGVSLLDTSSDWSHNRSVFTLVGGRAALERAALALTECAIDLIDLRSHEGVHPRIGAVDVMPFVPLRGSTMAECVELARTVGATVADRFAIPVFLYENAALLPARSRLEDVRRGQFEGLAVKLATTGWRPDFGPAQPHQTAGAVAIGARRVLVAFNVNLHCDRLDVAKLIASTIRARSGGLPGVKALGLRLQHRGIVQVSMNLTDVARTTPRQVLARIEEEAAKHGVSVLESEVVGLVPLAALRDATPDQLKLAHFDRDRVLEHRIASTTV